LREDNRPPGVGARAGPRLHACLLTSAYPVDYTRLLDREAAALAAAGLRVTLIGLGDRVPDRVPPGVEVVPVSGGRGLGKAVLLHRLDRAARAARADVYHCCDPWALGIGLRITGQRPGTFLVYDSSESYPEFYRDRLDWPGPIRLAVAARVRCLERRASRRAAAVIETNATRAQRFERLGRTPVLVPNYPPLELAVESPAAREPWIAYTGLVSRFRGFDVLVRAFGSVGARLPDARLKVAGKFEPGSEAGMRKLVRECGLESRIDFLGWLPYRDLFRLLGRCSAGVILLQPGRWNDYTGLPNKLFEFMGAGLGVIASDFPEMAAVVSETGCGWLVDPADEDSVGRALEQALADSPGCRRRGEAGRQAVSRRYNWDAARAALLGVYGRLSP